MSERGRFDPVDVFVEASRSLIGRLFLIAGAFAVGCGVGGLFASGELAGLIFGFLGAPGIALGSVFASYGLMVMPMLFGFAFFNIRFEWSEKSLLVPILLAALLAYDMIGDSNERERQVRQQMEQAFEK